MAKVQTRRTVSLSRKVFDALKSYAERKEVAISWIVENALYPILGIVPYEENTAYEISLKTTRGKKTFVANIDFYVKSNYKEEADSKILEICKALNQAKIITGYLILDATEEE